MDKKEQQSVQPEIQHPTIREIDHQTPHPTVADSTSQETKRSSFYPTA
ncbi:hypothetical protein LC040_07885 [Bacillus tianshenii]|nr:hypothetical protein LC040_07885 [Bacillus tianshenii]